MIGLDRPLRPEWIYNILGIIQPGEKPGIYNLPFEEIAQELVGKEGKRKARTVIFRSYIYSMQEQTNIVEPNVFLHWAGKYSLNELKPIFLSKLMMDYKIARGVVKRIFYVIQPDRTFSVKLLQKQMVQAFGDRDVVKRSVNSFLATLVHFGVCIKNDDSYRLIELEPLTETQYSLFIITYMKGYLHADSMDLDTIEPEFHQLFNLEKIYDVAKQFHRIHWEYIRDHGRNILLLKNTIPQ